jgi:hypothetical protein
MKKFITAGMAVRRQIRRFLLEEGIDFVEEKGWLDSVFYLKCTDETFQWVGKVLEEHKRRMQETIKS